MTVRAKFTVTSHTLMKSGDATVTTVSMIPVVSGSDENKMFWKYTPSGRIELGVVNDDAVASLPFGKEVYVDFTPVEDV